MIRTRVDGTITHPHRTLGCVLVTAMLVSVAPAARAEPPERRLDHWFGQGLSISVSHAWWTAVGEESASSVGAVYRVEGSLAGMLANGAPGRFYVRDWWTVDFGAGLSTASPYLMITGRLEPALRVVGSVGAHAEVFGMVGYGGLYEYSGGLHGAAGLKLTAGARVGGLLVEGAYMDAMALSQPAVQVAVGIGAGGGQSYANYLGVRAEYSPVGSSMAVVDDGGLVIVRLFLERH